MMRLIVLVIVATALISESIIVAKQVQETGRMDSSIVIPAVVVIAAIGGLAALCWRMLSQRIDRVEQRMDDHSSRLRDLDRLNETVRTMHQNLLLIPQIHDKLLGMQDSDTKNRKP